MDKNLRHMKSLVSELETEIRRMNKRQNSKLDVSFSGFVDHFPAVTAELERIFMKFTDRVNFLAAKEERNVL